MIPVKKQKTPRPKDKAFSRYWKLFIKDIALRSDANEGHLEQLTVLCQLYTEFHKLSEVIMEEGYTYESVGRNGTQQKVNSSVIVRDKITAEIRQYSKLLNIALKKGDDTPLDDGEKDEW